MDLSRRSLAVSLVFHLSLVGGGILWSYSAKNRSVAVSPDTGQVARTQLVSRPVKIKRELPKPSSSLLGKGEVSPRKAVESVELGKTGAVSNDKSTQARSSPVKPSVSTERSYPTAKGVSPKRDSASVSVSSAKREREEQASGEKESGPRGWGPVEAAPQPSATPGEGGRGRQVTRRARPVSQPEYSLSERFPKLKSVSVRAEFQIEEDGSYEPTLLSSTGNPTADVVILAKLLEYEWLPALEKGKAVKDTRILDISLDD